MPSPESVVTLLKAAKIKNIRIYDADKQVLSAFKGSGIDIVVGLGNLLEVSVGEDRAMNWIKENVQPFIPGTRIRGIAVGNEILGGGDVGLWEALLPAAKNVYNALKRLGLDDDIQVRVLIFKYPLIFNILFFFLLLSSCHIIHLSH